MVSGSQGGHLLARWTHGAPAAARCRIQSFLDIDARQTPVADYGRRTFDLDTQCHTALGARQDLVAGLSYRFSTDDTRSRGFVLSPATDLSRSTGLFGTKSDCSITAWR